MTTDAPTPGGGPAREIGLLEREVEIASIAAVTAAATRGEARMLLVEGPAGMGKTRLLAEAKRAALEAGMRVLTARGSEIEREFPHGVVRQLFEGTLTDPVLAGQALAGAAASARPVFGAVGAVPAEGDTAFATLHGLYWLTVNLSAERPLALVVDDLHWIDRPSLRFLAFLVRRLEDLPVLVVGSLRPAEPGADQALLAELARDPLTVPLHPPPLSAEATATLVASRLGAEPDDAFTGVCHETTGGNPLLLHELLRALHAEGVRPDATSVQTVRDIGPRAVSRAVLVRLSRLGPDAVEVARALAVLGDGAELRHVAALAGVDDETAARATGDLARSEILRPDPPLGFVHPLVRDAVHMDVAPGERPERHGRAARLLAAAGAPDEQVAAHLLAAPPGSEPAAATILVRAGATALTRGAPDSAVAYLGRALDEGPPAEVRADILHRLGLAEISVHGPSAVEHLRRAHATTTDPRARAEIATQLSPMLIFTGRPGEAADLARATRAELAGRDDDLADQLEAAELCAALYSGGPPLGSAPFAEARTRTLGPGVGARFLAGVTAYQWAMTGGRAADCVPLALHAVSDGVLVRAKNGSIPFVGAQVVLIAADREEGRRTLDESLATAHRTGSTFAAAAATAFSALSLLCQGDLEDAERRALQAVDHIESWGFDEVRLYPYAYLAEIRTERGDHAGAEAALAAARMPDDDEIGAVANLTWWLAARLRHLLATGRSARVVELTDGMEERFGSVAVNPAWIPWGSLRATALHALGRSEEAAGAAAREVALARTWGGPRVLGRALRVLGSVTGDVSAVEESVSVLEPSWARLEHARSLAALGTALRLGRRPTDAREPLRRALEMASVCGAAPLVEHVRAELQASGVRPRSDAMTGVSALTPSEHRVATFAADGQSNRDIAQALYVTPKTVEVHLSNAYRKLGIRSRRELAGALA